MLSVANCPEDELGVGYEYLIKKFADDSGHTAAEFYTNRTVVHLMTEMLEPAPGESIYDPTCGSAGMLLSAVAHLKRQGKEWRNLRLFGQERNLLTSAIGRMNLFLHGIEDFEIARGDTLANPLFVRRDKLRQFDVVLANPPYSIKQWDRDAWASDPWGRNIYGTPPQGRADYAFWQHIIQSMKPKTGRCAILFPHGVLFRNEEAAMREKLLAHDVVECVLGLGPNLFYNSPMEACVVICRTSKPRERRNKVLFINAVNEVTRERAQRFLASEHIERITSAYHAFADEEGFSRVVRNGEICAQGSNLSIPLYVRANSANGNGASAAPKTGLRQVIADWLKSSATLRESMDGLFAVLEATGEAAAPEPIEVPTERETSSRKAPPAFKRAVLAAEVTAQLHAEPTFGAVKHEKVVFLCERMCGLSEELEHHHLRQAAGPYDPKARRSTEKTFAQTKWFTISRDGGRTSYVPGENFGGHKKYFPGYFAQHESAMQRIINLLRSLDSTRCEIVATLYAVWDDFLAQGQEPSDEQIVHEVLHNWHESKQRIHGTRWQKALGWMREKGLTPLDKARGGAK